MACYKIAPESLRLLPSCIRTKTWAVLPLLFVIFLCAGGSVALVLPSSSSASPYDVEISPLENEVPLFINEFADIVAQYQKIPPGSVATKSRVEIQRRLLERLNKMKPQSAFLEGQKIILQASLRARLRINGSSKPLYELAVESTEPSVRDDAVLTLVYGALRNSDQKALTSIYNDTQSMLSYPLKSFIALLLRPKEYISPAEAAYLINYYLENMVDEYQDSTTLSRLIDNFAEKVDIKDIDRITDKFLAGNQPTKALPFVRFRLEKEEMDFNDLLALGMRFGKSESSFVSVMRSLPARNEEMKKYLALYEERYKARARGRSFNIELNRYRGTKKHPYNLAMAEKSFSNYLSGPVEDQYITDNAERAVRNYLASRRFDLIEKHLTVAMEKIWDGFYSPYLNFWLAYSRLQQGQTNGVPAMLTEIISESPETYFGLMSVELLTHLFRAEPNGAEIRRTLFGTLKSGMGSSDTTSRVSSAVVLYYLGNKIERNQAESILSAQGLVDNASRKGFSKSGALLAEAYINLGLQNAARRILYSEGIDNPFEQDIIFSSLFEEAEAETGYVPIFSRKKSLLVGGQSRIIGTQALKAYYPRPFPQQVARAVLASDNLVDENLVYAIMRQESFYRTNARSRAGARGLMQLMPATARLMARSVLDSTNYSLYDPSVNILLGTAYLSGNVKRLGLIPALAAYNGGPGRVLEVKIKYEPQNTFEFIEVHPIKETRNYMKKVLEHYNRYSVIYDGACLDFSQTSESLF